MITINVSYIIEPFLAYLVRIYWSHLEHGWNEKFTCHLIIKVNNVIFGLYYDLKYVKYSKAISYLFM